VLEEMNKIAKEVGLKGFEMARNIYLEPVGFLARGILTNTMKLQRHEAKLSYADEIKGMYD
jgi:long-chain acyl-CoA synthetase